MIDFLCSIEIFSELDDKQLDKIISSSVCRSYKRGVHLFSEEDVSDGVYIIKSGYVKVYLLSESGREQTLTILSSGDVIGEVSVYSNATRSASVQTIEPTEFIFIPRHKFKDLLNLIPSLNMKIAEIITERLRFASRQVARLAELSSREKVLTALDNLAELHGKSHEKGVIIQPRLTHNDIASLVGLVRETVTKTINELADDGIITYEGRRLIIVRQTH